MEVARVCEIMRWREVERDGRETGERCNGEEE
jgi:hypothetical protein